MLEFGSKAQVFKGKARRTKGGLTKDDIIQVRSNNGTVRYKYKKKSESKKNSKWIIAFNRALEVMKKIRPGEFDGTVMLCKDSKKNYKGFLLYQKTKEIYCELLNESKS